MSATLRRLTILVAVLLVTLLLIPALHATTPPSQFGTNESMLLNAANRDRAANGLAPLQWDNALATAARQHALRMVQANTLSHQFPGEPALQDRATQTGARFRLIAENIAEGPNVVGLHTQWMNSPPHRANLLDPQLNAVGMAVVQSGNMLFAVQDFAAAVPQLSLEAQETMVAEQIVSHGLRAVNITTDARKTCALDNGWSGQKPGAVARYEAADLTHLPDEIAQKILSGKYRSAAVGACDAGVSAGFARFRVAILLY
jgi:hypothetical protein